MQATRERGHEAPEGVPDRAPRPEPAPPPADAIRRLQRSAGNHAVAALLERRAPHRLMRFGTGEHAQLGGARQATVNGVVISEGELIAMGDFYATPEKLNAAPKAELLQLVALIRREKQYSEGVEGVKKVTTAEWEGATRGHAKGETYTELAFANDAHFGPDTRTPDQRTDDQLRIMMGHWGSGSFRPGPAKGDNRGEFEKHHLAATVQARTAALGGAKTVPDEAVVQNGFAAHFLTDAFSSGHIRSKSQIMDFAKLEWIRMGANETWFDIIPESEFTVAVAQRVLADPTAGAKLRDYKIRIIRWGDMSVTKLSELIFGMQGNMPELFYSIFAGLVHDRLNASIESDDPAGLPPLQVTNERGDGPWSLAGDGSLALSPETSRIAKAAVEESYRNLELAVADPRGFDVAKAIKRVWAYVPKPTAQGGALINQVVADYADVSNPKTQQAAADYIIAEIDTVIAGLVKENRLKRSEDLAKEEAAERLEEQGARRHEQAEFDKRTLPGGSHTTSTGSRVYH